MSYDAMDSANSFRHEQPSLAPPSQLTSRASGSTDHSLGKAPNTAFINSSNDAAFPQAGPHIANEPQPLEMELPLDDPGYRQAGYPTELKKGLGERHTNMIAFSSVLGIGFFLQAGRVIYLAGPGLAWIAYIIMGTALWSAMASLGEMTALFPVKGAIFEFPSRFVDAAIGYACGWMSWHAKISIQIRHLDYILTDYRFAWVVVIAAEVTAVASLFRFEFDVNYLRSLNYPGTIDWTSTADISPAIFVVLWLLFILAINLLRVRIYGEIEYVIGCIKMVFLVGLIMFNIINNIRTATYFKYYQDPWGFESRNFTSSRSQSYEGGSAHLAAMWTAMTVTIFSMMGFEVVSITAPENKDLDTEESIKLATRKISLRIILLYTLGAFVVGLNVPYDDPQISDRNVSSFASGAHSVFVVAAVRDGVLGFPSFFNGFFIFSATSAGLNALYISSRLLHALANVGDVWPSWSVAQSLRRRLERTSDSGVPRAAVLTSWLFGWLAMLAVKSDTTQVLGNMATNSTVSILIVYTIICAAYLRFFRSIRRAVQGREPPRLNPGQDRAAYDREDRARYPYKSHWQYVRAWYGMIACGAMAFFNGWRSISPVDGPEFVASYISIIIFFLLVAAYHIKIDNTWNPLEWSITASEDLANPERATPADPTRRRGKLTRRDREHSVSWQNAKAFCEWVWVWLK